MNIFSWHSLRHNQMENQLMLEYFWDGSCGKHQGRDIILHKMLSLFLLLITRFVSPHYRESFVC